MINERVSFSVQENLGAETVKKASPSRHSLVKVIGKTVEKHGSREDFKRWDIIAYFYADGMIK